MVKTCYDIMANIHHVFWAYRNATNACSLIVNEQHKPIFRQLQGMALPRCDKRVLLDSVEHIKESDLGRECVSVVDVWIALGAVPTVHCNNNNNNLMEEHQFDASNIQFLQHTTWYNTMVNDPCEKTNTNTNVCICAESVNR